MGVIGSEGIVGVVNNVSNHFSTVIPLINPSFSVSGKFMNSGFFGPVQWKNTDYRYAYLVDIPRYADIEEGDTVVTDARSLIFPEGIHIGYVESYELQQDQNFFSVRLRLATDFASTNYVYIIEDKLREELEELEAENSTE
jgi:rod shape-determining protein MreC